MASPGHVIAVTFLDVLGLCMNAWFLYTVKSRQSPYNAIDALQATKTVLVILALLTSVWLDLITCSRAGSCAASLACVGSKAIIENLFFHSMCYSFLTVACIRRKVCKCRGRADVLITTRYAFKSLLLTFMPVGMFVAATVSLVSNYSIYSHHATDAHNNNANATDSQSHVWPNDILDLLLIEHSSSIYQFCHTMILNLIPLITSVVIYVNIVYAVRETADKTDGFISQRNRSPTKVITMSVAILLTCTCSLWTIYSITAIVAIFVEVNSSILTFLKLTILIVHPFGEGLLQPSSRSAGVASSRFLRERSSRQVCPESSPSISSFRDERGSRQLSEYLPALIEERESTRHSHSSSNNQGKKQSADDDLQVQKKRRPSIFHPRPSVLMRHAPSIGLEYREEPNIISLVKTRRESEERLKQGLKEIEDDAARHSSYRKLSACLRLSSPAELNERDVYEEYRKRYLTSSKKQRKESKLSTPSIVEEYKGLTYANDKQVDNCASPSTSWQRKRSQKRWWKLVTTAKTASRFSNTPKPDEPTIEESEIENARNAPEDSMRRGSRGSTQHKNSQGRKKRSMSTSKNIWLEPIENSPGRRGRNKSVSFISNIVVDNNIPGTSPRSFSYDAQISVNYKNDAVDLGLKHKKRSEGSTNKRRGNARNLEWTVTEATTREECIEKLQEWKAYF